MADTVSIELDRDGHGWLRVRGAGETFFLSPGEEAALLDALLAERGYERRWAVEQPTIGCDEPSYYVYHSRYAAEVAASESDFLRVVRIVVIPTDRGENDG